MLKIEPTGALPPVYVFSGRLDESANEVLLELKKELAPGDVTFDLERISSLNSIGVSQWVLFMRHLSPEVRVRMRRCSASFVDFLRMVPAGLGHGTIESGMVIGICNACDREQLQLVALDATLSPPPDLSLEACTHCGGDLVLAPL